MSQEEALRPTNSEEFVAMWYSDANSAVEEYLHPDSQSYVGDIEFSELQMEKIRKIVRQVVVESYFHFLLGFDGSPVAGVRQKYQMLDEKGT